MSLNPLPLSPFTRVVVPPSEYPGDAGIRVRYPLDGATWIWHPEARAGERSVVRFQLDFELPGPADLEVDLSADQRYCLSCDGIEASRGPDRAELGGWSFSRLRLPLRAGPHRLEVLAWWLPEKERPSAQVSARPGFALVGLGTWGERVSTGIAPWRAAEVKCWTTLPRNRDLSYHVIGAGFAIDGSVADGDSADAMEVARGRDDLTGQVSTPWRLAPSPLPEQARALVAAGRIRLVGEGTSTAIGQETGPGKFAGLARGEPVTVPAGSSVQVLWDLEEYVCGYTRLVLAGGSGASVEVEWAEALYENPSPTARTAKGDRAACAGKFWLGFGDRFLHPGGEHAYESPWWRSGRWLRLVIRTTDEPLVIMDARPLRTGYPFTRAWAFAADRDLGGTLDLCEAGLRNCVHETFVDCPYYEQLQYVGDTRVQALAWLVASGDPRPVRRALELFDRSRWVNGFVAERCPAGHLQMSSTYSLVQPHLLRDYAWWADDLDFVRGLLPGTRSALEYAIAGIGADGLPSRWPGWNFVDWVARPDWRYGVPGGDSRAVESPIALHLPLALDAAARVEDALGDPDVARRWRRIGAAVMGRIVEVFYDATRGVLADDAAHRRWSEHAQAMALDCAFLPAELRPGLVAALVQPPDDFALASVYFSHHVHEALLRAGEVEAFLNRLGFWEDLRRLNFVTTVEAPEPARSDCHGWGAHPLYHALSALAGVRPAAAAFARVRITPRLGPLRYVRAVVPHPRGEVEVDLRREGETLVARIASPVGGEIEWAGQIVTFAAEEVTIHLGGSARAGEAPKI